MLKKMSVKFTFIIFEVTNKNFKPCQKLNLTKENQLNFKVLMLKFQ